MMLLESPVGRVSTDCPCSRRSQSRTSVLRAVATVRNSPILLLVFATLGCGSEAEPVPKIPQAKAAIEAAIREAAGKPTGELTKADWEKLTSLSLRVDENTDLTALARLTKLKEFRLRGGEIADLMPLAELLELETLYVNAKQITDLAPLARLTKLKKLGLHSHEIADLTPLAELQELERLYLGINQIIDLTPLAGLNALKELWLYGNQINGLTPLAELQELEMLSLDYNEITDLTPLAGLTRLERLYVGNNQIIDVTPLAGSKGLKTLLLFGNQITDLSPLAELTALEYLSLKNNEITDLTPLAGLTDLRVLDLNDNELADLTPLAELNWLTALQLDNNQITDLAPLVGMKKLMWIDLNANRGLTGAEIGKLRRAMPAKCRVSHDLGILRRDITDNVGAKFALATLIGLIIGIVLSFKSRTSVDQLVTTPTSASSAPAILSATLRPLAGMILFAGLGHYTISLVLWGLVLYGYGINRDTYEFWLRDALPALVLFLCYVTSIYVSIRRPHVVWWWAGILACLSVGHFVLDNTMHHFTVSMMYPEEGCVWSSPTWWWYEHRCGVWCN